MKRLELFPAFFLGEENERSGPGCLLGEGEGTHTLLWAVVHLSLLTGFEFAFPELGWRVALTRTVWLLQPLSHLSVLCSAGSMDSAYEGQSSGICAVALYDYQGGGSALRAQGKALCPGRAVQQGHGGSPYHHCDLVV